MQIRKRLGKGSSGTQWLEGLTKAVISRIGEKYYTGYEVREEMKLNSGESLKPGQLDDIREAKNFEGALHEIEDVKEKEV